MVLFLYSVDYPAIDKKIGKANGIHGMIDSETLGVNPDSVVLTAGAIKFGSLAIQNLIRLYI